MLDRQARKRGSVPQLPWGFVFLPKFFEQMHIADCIHAMPKIIMLIGAQLPVCGNVFQRFEFPGGVITLNILSNAWLQDEKSAIDPPFADLGFFSELHYAIIFDHHLPKTRGRADGCHRDKFLLFPVKIYQLWNIHIAHAVTICEHEWFVSNKFSCAFDSAASISFRARVQEMHDPVFAVALVCGYLPGV